MDQEKKDRQAPREGEKRAGANLRKEFLTQPPRTVFRRVRLRACGGRRLCAQREYAYSWKTPPLHMQIRLSRFRNYKKQYKDTKTPSHFTPSVSLSHHTISHTAARNRKHNLYSLLLRTTHTVVSDEIYHNKRNLATGWGGTSHIRGSVGKRPYPWPYPGRTWPEEFSR